MKFKYNFHKTGIIITGLFFSSTVFAVHGHYDLINNTQDATLSLRYYGEGTVNTANPLSVKPNDTGEISVEYPDKSDSYTLTFAVNYGATVVCHVQATAKTDHGLISTSIKISKVSMTAGGASSNYECKSAAVKSDKYLDITVVDKT